jgi:hypothetical protein
MHKAKQFHNKPKKESNFTKYYDDVLKRNVIIYDLKNLNTKDNMLIKPKKGGYAQTYSDEEDDSEECSSDEKVDEINESNEINENDESNEEDEIDEQKIDEIKINEEKENGEDGQRRGGKANIILSVKNVKFSYEDYFRKQILSESKVSKSKLPKPPKSSKSAKPKVALISSNEMKDMLNNTYKAGDEIEFTSVDVTERCVGDITYFKRLVDEHFTPDEVKEYNFEPIAKIKSLFNDKTFIIIDIQYDYNILQNPLSIYKMRLRYVGNDYFDINKQNIYRILKPEYPRVLYREHTFSTQQRSYHWGQRKLHLSEVEFLTLFYQRIEKDTLKNKDKKKNKIVLIYAGSANGDHIPYLMEMFPEVHFELYDPAPFCKKLHEMEKAGEKVKIHNEYFLDSVAEKWCADLPEHKDTYILYVTDIRTVSRTSFETDEIEVKKNMDWQKNWYYIMKPYMSMYKFRLPWNNGYEDYMEGDIHFQVYAPASSSESRLIVYGKDVNLIKYDNKAYEEQFAYFSQYGRIYEKFDVKKLLLDDNENKNDDDVVVDKKKKSKSVQQSVHQQVVRQHVDELEQELKRGFLTDNYDSLAELLIIKNYLKFYKKQKNITIKDLVDMSIETSSKISSYRTLAMGTKMQNTELSVFKFLKDNNYIPKNMKETRENYNEHIISNDNFLKIINDNIDKISAMNEKNANTKK